MSDDIIRRAARMLNDPATPLEDFVSGLTRRTLRELTVLATERVAVLWKLMHPDKGDHDDSDGACRACYVGPLLTGCSYHYNDRDGTRYGGSTEPCWFCDESRGHYDSEAYPRSRLATYAYAYAPSRGMTAPNLGDYLPLYLPLLGVEPISGRIAPNEETF